MYPTGYSLLQLHSNDINQAYEYGTIRGIMNYYDMGMLYCVRG